MRYTVQSRAPATLPVAAVRPRGGYSSRRVQTEKRITILQSVLSCVGLGRSTACNWRRLPVTPMEKARLPAVRKLAFTQRPFCKMGPAQSRRPYVQTKGHYLRTMPLVWHNERSSRVAFQAALESKWCR